MNSVSKGEYNKLIMCVPCLFTTLNLLMGIIVIVFMIVSNSNSLKILLPLLIMFAGFCDWIDGKIARKLGVDSRFGKQLDSFADSISFGLAPVTLVLHQLAQYAGFVGIMAAIIFPVAGIYRLARFNITEHSYGFFEGLPIPVAGICIAMKHLIISQFSLQGNAAYIDSYMTSSIMILLSLLMVSRIRVKKI